MSVDIAINFVLDKVIYPALESNDLDQTYKNKVKNSERLIKNFRKTGDLFKYLKRFQQDHGTNNEDLYNALKSEGLNTFEGIYPEFKNKFKYELEDVTTLDDFIIGEDYNSYDIAIFAETYNIQSGIYLVGDEPDYQAIFVKATLEDGDYPNEWLKEDQTLKYYMYAVRDKYKIDYKYNESIIKSSERDIPIYVFIKDGKVCTLNGIYKYEDYFVEEDDKKWFKLNKINSIDIGKPMTKEEFEKETYEKAKEARRKGNDDFQGIDKPVKIQTVVTEYKRNPIVVSKVLERADGVCELCNEQAPFLRKADNTPYLETHHIIPLSEEGSDTIDNVVAVCPNCHAEQHYGA